MSQILNTCVATAVKAGDFLLRNFGRIRSIEKKGDRNFATNLDIAAEKMILADIRKVFPGHAVLAEESGASGDSEYLWVIDPLDGTHNFMRNIDIFGVSVGVMRGQDFFAGCIYMPSSGELYCAQKGKGAFKNKKRIHVSKITRLDECSISFDSSIRHEPRVMLPALGALAHRVFNLRMTGSSVRQLSWVAEGKLDCAVEFFDKPWDFVAGACIIQEAGGTIVDLFRKPLSPFSTGYIASNGLTHSAFTKLLAPYTRKHSAKGY